MPHLWAKLPDGSTKEQAESVKATLKTLLENRERTIPVSSDIELKPIQINPVDIELLAIKDDIDREICRYFGVLPHLVGVKMESGKTYSNVSMENRHLVDHALSRWITILECELSRWLPEGQKVKFNMTDLVRPTLPERTKSYQISGGNKPWMTIQEIRQARRTARK